MKEGHTREINKMRECHTREKTGLQAEICTLNCDEDKLKSKLSALEQRSAEQNKTGEAAQKAKEAIERQLQREHEQLKSTEAKI